MNNQSYLLSESARASRLSPPGHLQSTEQSQPSPANGRARYTGRAPAAAAADAIELLLQRNFNVGSAAAAVVTAAAAK